jgi:eukaryotic-like serine/threonine-protein kinase
MAQRDDATGDLLLGLIALQDGRIDPAQLVAAFRAWTGDESRPMAEILVGQGALDEPTRALLEGQVAEHLARRGGDSDSPETVAYISSNSPGGGDAGAPRGAGGSADADGPRFRILRPHARGGLGEVFLALDPELNRQVALKELRARRAFDAASQSRFLREAEVTGRLEHPGIVPVYGLGRYADGRPYYAMRFIEGETLKDAIQRFHRSGKAARGPGDRDLAFRRLLRSVIDACNAVGFAHSRGVVHRDIKPENIMLGRFGETLVVDWGVAKPLSDAGPEGGGWSSLPGGAEEAALTVEGAVIGTPQYMSPEQAEGDQGRVGAASDVYSLGATLYCVLAGRGPFPDGDVQSVLRRVRRGIFPAPRRLRRSVDSALEAICLKAMALRPEDRHATPLALAAEIEAWLADVRYRGEQEDALSQARRSLARLCFERAQNLFGRERHAEGMLWLARALENVPPDGPGLERAIRASLGGWHLGAKLMERVLAHGGAVLAVAFSPDGRRLATACDDGAGRLWDVATGTPIAPPMAHEGPVAAVAFSPDGRTVATAGHDGALRRWDALTGAPLGDPARHGAAVRAVCFSPDGSRIATAGGPAGVGLWCAESGRPILGAEGHGHDATVLAVAFTPDGARLATAGDDGRVRLWEAATGALIGEPLSHGAGVTALGFSPDGRTLLTGCLDGTARLWDVERGAALVELAHRGEAGCARFNPAGGSVATACPDGTARLWDAATGTPIGEPLAHRSRVDRLEFDRDGALIASAGLDGTVRLWDAATALPIGPPLEHRGAVHALAFSPDGQRLATGGSGGVARCWKVPPAVAGSAERVSCWAGVATGLEFDAGDAIRRMDHLATWELRRRLYDLGGPPIKSENH